MAIEIVDFPIKNGGSFHSYVKLPEGRFVCLGMMGHDSLRSLSCCCIVLILTGIACWLKHVRVWRRRRIGGSCCARSRRIPRPAGRQYDWFTFYNPPRQLIIWFYNCHSLSIILGICMFIHTHTHIYIYISHFPTPTTDGKWWRFDLAMFVCVCVFGIFRFKLGEW